MELLILEPDYPGNCVGRDIFSYHTPGPDHGAVSNRNPGKNNCSIAYPYILTNDYRLSFWDLCDVVQFMETIIQNVHACPDHAPAPIRTNLVAVMSAP